MCITTKLCGRVRSCVSLLGRFGDDMDDFQPTNKRLRQHEANGDYFQPPTKRHEAEVVSGVCSACDQSDQESYCYGLNPYAVT